MGSRKGMGICRETVARTFAAPISSPIDFEERNFGRMTGTLSSKHPDLECVTRDDIAAMDPRERVNFVNSLPGFKSLILVGTRNGAGLPNLSIISTAIHLGSDPPLLGMICRPAKVERHTYENIKETGTYTFNHVHESFYPQAHQTSARYPREISEFTSTGLTEFHHPEVTAPFVAEANLRIALKLVETLPVQANGVTLLVGEVIHVFYPTAIRERDGYLDLGEAGTIAGAGLDAYYRANRLDRLSYAKPDRPLTSLERGIGDPEASPPIR